MASDPYMDQLNQLPPDVRQYILTHPFYQEGQRSQGAGWPTPYAGQDQEARSYWQGPRTAVPSQPTSRRAQDISYQPGGNAMAGPWWGGAPGGGSPGMGAGAPGGQGQNDPRMALVAQILANPGRGMFPGGPTAGMQPTSMPMRNAMGQPLGGAPQSNALAGQLAGGIPPQILQLLLQQGTLGGQGGQPNISPQVAALLAHYFGGAGAQGPQAQPSPGPFPQGGSADNLAQPT